MKMKYSLLATEVFACVLTFAIIHFLVMYYDKHAYHFNHVDNRSLSHTAEISAMSFRDILNRLLDALYFSLVTQSTVGYGSIVPLTNTAKLVASVQIATTLLFVIRWTTV